MPRPRRPGPRDGGVVPRHPRRGQLLPREAGPRHRRPAGRQPRTGADRRRPRAAARLHQRRALPAAGGQPAARRAPVHRHREERHRRQAPPLPRGPVLSQDAGRDGRPVRRASRSPAQHARDRRALRRRPAGDEPPPAELRRAGAVHVARRVLRPRGPRGLRGPARPPGRPRRPGRPEASPAAVRGAAGLRDPDDPAHGVRGLLPHRLGLHPPRAGAGRAGGPRAGLGGREPGRLLPAHHGRGPAGVRPHLRALPQPGAGHPAGHRHRLLRAAARRDHRVRHAEVRPRERRPDHHVRDHEGARRRPRRRAHAGHELRGRGSRGQADSRRRWT